MQDNEAKTDNAIHELAEIKRGAKGACYCCEIVGELNVKLEDENKRLRECLLHCTGNLDKWEALRRKLLEEVET